MKKIQFAFVLLVGITSCVPVKKYNEAIEAEKKASEELTAIKSKSIENENARKDLEVYTTKAKADIIQLRKDTASLGSNFRFLQAQYDIKVAENEVYEHTIDQMRLKGSKETAGFQADIEMRNQELQRKEEALKTMEQELIAKQKMLFEREQRVTELEEMLERKDMAMQTLKAKLVTSLKCFESKGLTVVEKNGKIYVSMEAKLLFASGSTTVEQEGKNALINLAKVLENEKDLEIAFKKLNLINLLNKIKIFEIDKRKLSLFVSLVINFEITENYSIFIDINRSIILKNHVSFVALKNGMHSSVGYIFSSFKINNINKVQEIFKEINNFF
jgi:chemotaxis protein MotB